MREAFLQEFPHANVPLLIADLAGGHSGTQVFTPDDGRTDNGTPGGGGGGVEWDSSQALGEDGGVSDADWDVLAGGDA